LYHLSLTGGTSEPFGAKPGFHGAIAILLAVWTQAERLPEYLSRARHAVLAPGSGPPSAKTSGAAGRRPVACPPAGDRTMVALVFGQSHAANVVKERFVGDTGVFNYFQGHCYAATDPLLGTDNDGGNVWTLVGNELVRQRRYDAVVLVTIGISGSYIGRWAPGGRLHAHLMEAINSVGPEVAFTHVFIQQGESDLMAGTPTEEYFARFAKVIAALRQKGISAPIFVAIESGYCDGAATPPMPDNPIVLAQKRLIAAHEGVYFGPDMDAQLNSASDRYDGCHMSGAGARKLSLLWTTAIAAPVSGRQRLN
jgi:lysophospholipase L1-like esterase